MSSEQIHSVTVNTQGRTYEYARNIDTDYVINTPVETLVERVEQVHPTWTSIVVVLVNKDMR